VEENNKMSEQYVINVDLAKLTFTDPTTHKEENRILGWGDTVEIENPTDIKENEITVQVTVFQQQPDNSVKPINVPGTIMVRKTVADKVNNQVVVKKSESKVLKLDFVDVQQGDGAVIETPQGKIILIDGGDNQLFARYLANRFRKTSDENPRFVDCILVTHGDADHFLGLTKIQESEDLQRLEKEPWKRIFICPERVFHNGLVLNDAEANKEFLGITELEENLINVSPDKMNEPFKLWQEVLGKYQTRLKSIKGDDREIEFRRIEIGMDSAFSFLDENIKVKVLAPVLIGNGLKRGLKFLHTPPEGPHTSKNVLNTGDEDFSKSFSASHTINGHSIVFQLRYGGFTFMFCGDLNNEAERILTRAHNRNQINLQSDVLKVPHHGSHDFSSAFLQAVAPITSIISSGDESARKEFIHPRANLLGALGRFSRVEEPLIFITELVAFFQIEGWIRNRFQQLTEEGKAVENKQEVVDPAKKDFFAFSRAAFGLVMARTDGNRLLIYTNSALSDMKEAYAFEMDEFGKPVPVELLKT
jgi:beta-lactamase superfamily II metal-dependent hydrolase